MAEPDQRLSMWRRSWRPDQERWSFVLALAALTLVYAVTYYLFDARPNVHGKYPLGWWGWFDQGEYLKSTVAWTTGHLTPDKFLYPPLYPLALVPFWLISHSHGAGLLDLLLTLVYFGILLRVARRFYGPILPALVCAALIAAFPLLIMWQWVVPWTTTLSAALMSVLILAYSNAETRSRPFVLSSRRPWLEFAAFFLSYGALVATRPLDIVIWFPAALAFFLRTTVATVLAAPQSDRLTQAVRCCALAGLGGAFFVVCYLLFNILVTGHLLGTYSSLALDNGYFIKELGEKILSMLWDSRALYGENGMALFQYAHILLPVFVICFITLFFVRDVRLVITATSFLYYAAYLPYGDLLPSHFFKYYLIHYFNWTYPWMAVIAAGQLLIWLEGVFGGRRTMSLYALGATAALLAIAIEIDIRPTHLAPLPDIRSATERTVTVTSPVRRSVQFVDIIGVAGPGNDFPDLTQEVRVDGQPLPNRLFRAYSVLGNARLVFLRPLMMKQIVWRPSSTITVPAGSGQSFMGSVSLAPRCDLRGCRKPLGEPQTLNIDLAAPAPEPDMRDWWPAETWGRWTNTADAALIVPTPDPAKILSITSRFGPLLGAGRTSATVSLWVNNCKLSEIAFTPQTPSQTVQAPIPPACLHKDSAVRIEWRTDRIATPEELHMNDDKRALGVGVQSLALIEAP